MLISLFQTALDLSFMVGDCHLRSLIIHARNVLPRRFDPNNSSNLLKCSSFVFRVILLSINVLKEEHGVNLHCDYCSLVELSLLPLSVPSICVFTQASEVRFTFSRTCALALIIFGALFDVASLFFPWGIITSSSAHVYLPGSIIIGEVAPLSVDDFLILMQVRAQLETISELVRAATVVGWASVILYWYVERRVPSRTLGRVISYGFVLASSFLSFTAVAMFALTEFSLSWGAYLALVGGVLMVLGVVMAALKVEVVLEREAGEQGE